MWEKKESVKVAGLRVGGLEGVGVPEVPPIQLCIARLKIQRAGRRRSNWGEGECLF